MLISRNTISGIIGTNPHGEAAEILFKVFEEDIARQKKVICNEIDQLKQQHAEEIEKLQTNIDLLERNNLDYITKNAGLSVKFDSYRQAVKDILGGDGQIENE